MLLLQLFGRYGVEGQGEQARLPVFLTLEQISEIVDARIETVARSLGRWKRGGWLAIDA
jgi:CRP-like cAMP-binding protein